MKTYEVRYYERESLSMTCLVKATSRLDAFIRLEDCTRPDEIAAVQTQEVGNWLYVSVPMLALGEWHIAQVGTR